MKKTFRLQVLFRLAAFIFLFSLRAHAQDWRRPLNNATEPNFFQIQADFNQYWAGKKPEKGSGWKVFKRWEWYWGQRVYPDGRFPAAGANEQALRDWLSAHPEGVKDRDDATLWTSLGPSSSPGGYNGTGRVNCMAIHPDKPSEIWVGTPAGGLWKSETGGKTWTPKTDQHPTLGVSAIVFHPFNTKIMYIATGDGDAGDSFSMGVWRSDDGGETWKPTTLKWTTSQGRTIRALRIHPVQPQRLICAASDGIYYTANSGQTWTRTLSGGQFSDLEIRPDNPEVVYACNEGNIFRSINGGLSWQNVQNISGVGRIALCVSPAKPQWVGALCSKTIGSGFHSFIASSDGGQTWVQKSGKPNILGWSNVGEGNSGQGWYDLCAAASPFNADEIFTGGVNIWKSTDGGQTWKAASHWFRLDTLNVPEVHADHHNLYFDEKGALYNCNDGGIYRSGDSGASFENLTSNLSNSQIYRLGASQQGKSVMIGLQDNGSRFVNEAGEWTEHIGGDGMECLIDPTDPKIMYGSLYYGAFFQTKNGGKDWKRITRNIPDTTGAWITPFIINPKRPGQLWLAYQDVWRSDDYGANWQKVSQGLQGGTAQFLAMSGADTNRLYVATSSSIRRSDDGGKNWVLLTNIPANGFISRIAAHPDNAAELYVTMSGYFEDSKVWMSRDAGKSWENISGTLPNVPANCIAFHQNGKNGLYLGMDVGVFYRDSTISDWVRYNNGLPNTPVTDIEIRDADNALIAATYGRGLWTAKTLDNDAVSCPVVDGLALSDSAYTAATFSWKAAEAWGYQYRYRRAGATEWTLGPTVTETAVLQDGLLPGEPYEVQARARCQGKEGEWGPTLSFSTRSAEGIYCVSYGAALAQWIDSVVIANVQNASGNNYGYHYISDTIQLKAGETYPIALAGKAAGNPVSAFWRVWLDINADGDFDDSGELLFQRATTDPPAFARTFTVPVAMQSGATRLRIAMSNVANAAPCLVTQQLRDVEDYVVYVQAANTTAVTEGGVALRFDVQPNPTSDQIRLVLPSTADALRWTLQGADGKIYGTGQTPGKGASTTTISVAPLAAGVYWITVQDELGRRGQKRFVKY